MSRSRDDHAEIPEIPRVGLEPPGPLADHDERSPREARVVTVLIAVLAMVAGWLGYLVADANREANEAAGQSRAFALGLQAASGRLNEVALGRLDGLLRWQVADAHVSIIHAAEHASSDERFDTERLVATRVLRAAARSTSVEPGDPAHVDRDDDFPYRLLADATASRAAELVSRQDAASESADRWDRIRAAYLGALLVVAVGIYLLGFSLTLPRRTRVVFAGTAVALGVVGALWAVSALSPRPVPSGDLSTHGRFARGVHDLLTATTLESATRAVEHFDAVIDERPTFARAYDLRAEARQRRAVLRLGVDVANPSIFPIGDRLDILRDQRAALAEGLDDPRLAINLGFHEIIAGYELRDKQLVQVGLDRSSRVARLLEDRAARSSASYMTVNAAVARYNEALALIASGEHDDARGALAEAGALVRSLEAQSVSLATDIVGAALTDLELLAGIRPSMRSAVEGHKNSVVARRATRGNAGIAAVAGGRAVVSAELVRVEDVRLVESALADQRLAVIWYRKVLDRWQALPMLSSLDVRRSELRETGETWLHEKGFLRDCNVPGDYKVELYADGQKQLTLTTHYAGPELQAPTLRRLRFRLCVPAGWVGHAAVPGAVEGLVDPERKRGVFVFRVPAMPGRGVREQVRHSVERTVATLPHAGEATRGDDLEPEFVEWLLAVEGDRAASGADGSVWRYREGIVHVQAATVASGDEIVGVAVFGPQSFVSSGLGGAVLTSVRSAVEWQ